MASNLTAENVLEHTQVSTSPYISHAQIHLTSERLKKDSKKEALTASRRSYTSAKSTFLAEREHKRKTEILCNRFDFAKIAGCCGDWRVRRWTRGVDAPLETSAQKYGHGVRLCAASRSNT
jgi:hypothetical protein